MARVAELRERVVASRVDPDGYREEVELIGEGERLFSFRHLPETRTTAGLVICSPICADFMANYQREVALARELASRGVAVQRFHYRGTGNSEGGAETVTVDSLCDDARHVVADFAREAAISRMAVLGTRFGALTAAVASAGLPDAPIVLWEPTLDATAYFREAFRAKLIREAKEGRAGGESGGFAEELQRRGLVDLLGYAIHPPLFESSADRTLLGMLDERPHTLLIVQISGRKNINAAYETLATKLENTGYGVDVRKVEMAESWWFHADDQIRFRPLVDLTVEWLLPKLVEDEV